MSGAAGILEVEGLTKRFGGLTAVSNVDYSLKEGEVAGIIGPNGAGKSTLFNLITGLLPPTDGMIRFDGKVINETPPFGRVAMGLVRTFQLVSVFDSLTVLDNVVLSDIRFKRSYTSKLRFFLFDSHTKETVASCHDILGRVGLAERLHDETSELSYGEKRKLEIAMALALNPRVLLLDEPFAGLSDTEVDDLLELLKNVSAGLTLVVIEHKITKLIDLVERLTVMHEGEVIADGIPEEVINDAGVRQVYWGRGA